MRSSIRSRLIALVRAQWAGLLALFLVIAGGTAYAANTIGSSDIINGQVKSADIGSNQVQSVDIKDESVTGADIADMSGVDTCAISARVGDLCVRAENFDRTWLDANRHCANIGMHAPSLGEAMELAVTHDIPNVDATESFWTSELTDSIDRAITSNEDGAVSDTPTSAAFTFETVCVTDLTN